MKKRKIAFVDGQKYPIVEEIPGQTLTVMTDTGPLRANPRYLGWTFMGFSFNLPTPPSPPKTSPPKKIKSCSHCQLGTWRFNKKELFCDANSIVVLPNWECSSFLQNQLPND